jgi:hypothetical protein
LVIGNKPPPISSPLERGRKEGRKEGIKTPTYLLPLRKGEEKNKYSPPPL